MQNHLERRAGTDRREINRSSTAGYEWKWNDPSIGFLAGDDDDPYDPYWEPVKGQDDD